MILLLATLTVLSQGVDPVQDGSALVEAMHERYQSSWYETLTFEQQATFYRSDGSVAREQTWSEYMAVPGRLRIEVGAREYGNGIIFRSDSAYQFQSGAMTGVTRQVHSLLLLGFDVYRSDPRQTVSKLEALGFDLTKLRRAEWQERPAYVVGADEGDELSAQFWVDVERLVFVRQILPAGPEGQIASEVQFNRYEPLEGGWIAPEVRFLNDGRLTLLEEYSLIQANVALEDSLFDPGHW
ncbi:MAG: hypothetical protein ABFS14_06125 [Gemmatimonadota bacterium]